MAYAIASNRDSVAIGDHIAAKLTEVRLNKLDYLVVRRRWVHLQESMNGVMPWRREHGIWGKETFEKLAGNLTTSCIGNLKMRHTKTAHLCRVQQFLNVFRSIAAVCE